MGQSHESPKTEFVCHEIFISRVTISIDQKFYAELKKVYIMESEIQPLCLCYGLCLLAGTRLIFFINLKIIFTHNIPHLHPIYYTTTKLFYNNNLK
jgi:hypothetical protein